VRWLCSRWSAVLGRPGLRAAVTGIALLVVASLSVWQLRLAQQGYAELVPLDLPGAMRLRLPLATVQTLQTLTHTLRERSDTFLCVPGLGSLYFWTGEEPPTLDVIGHEIRLFSDERQAAMLNALLEHRSPIIVRSLGLAPPYPPFEARLTERFKPLTTIGSYATIGTYGLFVPR